MRGVGRRYSSERLPNAMHASSRWFAERLLEVIRADEKRLWEDMVVPVPLYRQRNKERGFNQAELFAEAIGEARGIPYRPVLLMRTRPRPEKHVLDYEEGALGIGTWRFCAERRQAS
jgi:predicted amidophosphoribosyltransferase